MAYALIAHRCGPGLYPEQTILAARHALACGADMVEMDVSYTSDRVPVICHDPNTKRIFGVDSLVSGMTAKDFSALRHISDPAFPAHTLEDVLRCGVAPILLHCKTGGGTLSDTVHKLIHFNYCDKAVLGVQSPEDVTFVHDTDPTVKVLAFMKRPELLSAFVDAGADVIRLWEEWVTSEAVQRIHEASRQVWVMAGDSAKKTVGYTTAERLGWWQDIGADGVLVNDIPWARKVLGLPRVIENSGTVTAPHAKRKGTLP